MKLVPVGKFEITGNGHGRWICELDGGNIFFDENGGRYSVDVDYKIMQGYGTHMGPFASIDDACYHMTHGIVPARLAALLLRNGILEKR